MPSEALRPTASVKEEHMKAIYLEEAIERFVQAGQNISKDQAIYMLNRLPYMEIVRCRECIHGHKIPKLKEEVACDIWGGIWTKNGFCSNGERED